MSRSLFIKSDSLYAMIAELHGLPDGCSKGVGGSMHLVDEKNNFLGSTAIVSNSIPVGVGFAFGQRLDKKKSRIFILLEMLRLKVEYFMSH